MNWKLGTIHEHVLLATVPMHIYESQDLIFILYIEIRLLVFDQPLNRADDGMQLGMRCLVPTIQIIS